MKEISNKNIRIFVTSEETVKITTFVYTKVYVEKLSHYCHLIVIYYNNFIFSWNQKLSNKNVTTFIAK